MERGRVKPGPGSEQEKRWREQSQACHRGYRKRAFMHYGERCVWCGEADKQKLQFDHVNEDGGTHRAAEPSASSLAYWLVKNGFPEGFQVLCRKCNRRKAWLATLKTPAWLAEAETVRTKISILPVREQEVLRLRYGLGVGTQPLRWIDVAAKVVNLTTGQLGVGKSTAEEVGKRGLVRLQKEVSNEQAD